MKHSVLVVFVIVVAIGVAAQVESPPSAAASGSIQSQPAPGTYEPSNAPLSGVETQGIGTPFEGRNTLAPYISVSEGWTSNAPRTFSSSGGTESSGVTALSGGLTLDHSSAKNVTSLSYSGGGQIYTADSDLDSQFHSLEFAQSVVAGRWSFLATDALSYQKDAFASLPSLLFPGLFFGNGGVNFKPGFAPGESIIGQNIARINNVTGGQVTYGFSRKTTLTTNFNYGLLHYFEDTGLLNNRQFGGGMGLDHRFGRNTVGVNYNFTRFSYEGLPEAFDSHTAQVMFSHVLTGRMSLEVGGGPSVIVSNFANLKSTKVYGSGQVSLHYHMRLTDLSAQYGRSVTNGSGVLPGAVTDSIGLNASRKLGRSISANLSGGYARNSGTFVNSSFNTVYMGTGVSHEVGRYATASLGYSLQRQTGSSTADLTIQSVTVSLRWGFRPVQLH